MIDISSYTQVVQWMRSHGVTVFQAGDVRIELGEEPATVNELLQDSIVPTKNAAEEFEAERKARRQRMNDVLFKHTSSRPRE